MSMGYRMGRFATLYLTLLSVSMAVLTTMEGMNVWRALQVACVACVFKAVASHLHHALYDTFHPHPVKPEAKTVEVSETVRYVGKVEYQADQANDKQLPCV